MVFSVIARKTFIKIVVIARNSHNIWVLAEKIFQKNNAPAEYGGSFRVLINYTVHGFLSSVDLLIVT